MTFISDQPIAFIEQCTTHSGKEEWRVTKEAIQLLETIDDEVSIFGIVGKYRTGKSYIMNSLLQVSQANQPTNSEENVENDERDDQGENSNDASQHSTHNLVNNQGFDLGHTTRGHTRGIWLWGKKLGTRTVLALDTEGLYDIENGSDKDLPLFSLSILLTTVLMINFTGALDTGILDQLGLVTRLTDMLHSDDAEGGDFNTFFPSLIFLARDFNLKISAEYGDEQGYLQGALTERKGFSKQVNELNMTLRFIKGVFPGLLLRTFVTPVDNPEENLDKMGTDSSLIKDKFLGQVQTLRSDIDRLCSIKTVNGVPLTGRRYARVVQTYVDAMNNNQQMSIPNAFEILCREEMQRAVQTGLNYYVKMWKEVASEFPIDPHSMDELNERYTTDAMDVALKQTAKMTDIHESIKEKLQEKINGTDDTKGLFHEYVQENNQESIKLCNSMSRELYDEFTEKLFPLITTEKVAQERFEALHNRYLEMVVGIGVQDAWERVSTEFNKDLNIHLEKLKMKAKEDEMARGNAVELAVFDYSSRLSVERNKFPITATEFAKCHEEAKIQAIKVGLDSLNEISAENVEERIVQQIEGSDGKRERFEQENNEKSRELCKKKAHELYSTFTSKLNEFNNEETARSAFTKLHKSYLECTVGAGIEDAWTNVETVFSKDLTIRLGSVRAKQKEEEMERYKRRLEEERRQREEELENERRQMERERREAERREAEAREREQRMKEEARRQQEQMLAAQRREEAIQEQLRQAKEARQRQQEQFEQQRREDMRRREEQERREQQRREQERQQQQQQRKYLARQAATYMTREDPYMVNTSYEAQLLRQQYESRPSAPIVQHRPQPQPQQYHAPQAQEEERILRQCSAMTLKGERCRRTFYGNHSCCFQHR